MQNFRKRLEQANNKLNIFADTEIFKKNEFKEKELYNLIKDFLTDEEKQKLFDYPHFRQLEGWIKIGIMGLISNENIILQILNNDNIKNEFTKFQIVEIIKKLSDPKKKQLLYNQDFIEKYQFTRVELNAIFFSLSEEAKVEILRDVDLITNKLQLINFEIIDWINQLSSEEARKEMIGIYYQLEDYLKANIVKTLSINNKLKILLEDSSFSKHNQIEILISLDVKDLSNFFLEHREFCNKNKIHPYEIIFKLNTEQQKYFVENLEYNNFTLNEKKEILATLKPEVKQRIDTTRFPEEYKMALNMKTLECDKRIILDLEKEAENYRGLDNLMIIYPEEFTEEQRAKFMRICEVCPNIEVVSRINGIEYGSTGGEYKEAEEWINSVIDNLNPEYSKAQKMAIIDNAIGKRISYSPDFETEMHNKKDARTLWRIISSRYGVCLGIAKVEQYMLSRVGIESEIIANGIHAFLKIKNIELPLANGKTIKGNTIVDPTWNLTAHRMGGKPDNFCISYEQARKNDVDKKRNDSNSHKADEKLQDATLNLDEQSLRKLFTSVGLADKEGNFPINASLKKSELLHTLYANQPEQNIREQFLLLSKICPEFATCQNASMNMLNTLLNNANFKFKQCVVNRVYDKADQEKKPVIFVYIELDKLGEKFYYADKEKRKFIEITQEEFTKQFECYQEDLKRNERI